MPPPETTPTGAESDEAAARLHDAQVLAALRAGDESAFVTLVERHHAALVRLAMAYSDPLYQRCGVLRACVIPV